MKKITSLILAFIMSLSLFTAFAENEICVYIDDSKIEFDVKPQIIGDRTMVPMRKIFEALGAEVSWDELTRTATGTKEGTVVSVTVGSATLVKNDEAKELDVAPVLIDDRTLVPARAIAESFDCKVDWDENTRSVLITTEEKEQLSPIDEATGLRLPKVCTWADGKTAAYSFTMDDNSVEAGLFYENEFKKYDIHGTSMIIAKRLDEQSTAAWQEIFGRGYFDLGSHSMSHAISYTDKTSYDKLYADTIQSASYLQEKFPGQKILTFAAPWGQAPVYTQYLLKGTFYANRAAGGGTNSATPENWYNLYCDVVQYGTPLSTMNGWIDSAISKGGWCVELYHGLGSLGKTPDAYFTNGEVFKEHMQYIGETKKDDIWAGSFTEVTQYIYERDSAEAKLLWKTDEAVGVQLTDKMDNDVFDYPLTLKVNVPADWEGTVNCKQGDISFNAKVFAEGNEKYVYVNTVPDGGTMVISK